jgi:hypothetical protein
MRLQLSVSHFTRSVYKIPWKELKRRRRSCKSWLPRTNLIQRLQARLAHLDGLLDEALEQTFPASDAVAIDIERESHDREARVLDSRTPLAGNRKVGQRIAQKH